MKNYLVSLALAAGCTASMYAQQTEKPNLVLFIADDCSFYDLGCYGSPDSKTPNIDRFATQGIRLTKTYQAVPMSSPTRHNLYTGVWPVRSGAFPNHTRVNEGTLSVVQQLHPQGYKVALVGKSHVAPDSVFPFDLYAPTLQGGDIDFDAIRKFISECKDKHEPYCLLVASRQPHTPWNKGDASQFDADKLTVAPMYVDIPETRRMLTHYLAEINYMDNEFGTLLSILDQQKETDKSVVVYLSEQGNSLPFAKWTCYDAGVHSACIVRWPGVIKPHSESDALVEYVDIVPTFIDIAGGKPIAPVDGKSFKNVLTGKEKTHKQYTFSLQTTRGIYKGSPYYGIRSVSDGRYRYIVNLTPEAKFQNTEVFSPLFKQWETKGETDKHAWEMTHKYQYRPAIELYDVEKDPYCMKNLADDPNYKTKINELDKQLKGWMKYCGDEGQETEMDALNHLASNLQKDITTKEKKNNQSTKGKKKRNKKH